MVPPRRPRRAPAAPARPSRRPLLLAALLAATVALTYSNSLGSPFIWDDQTAVENNRTIQSLSTAWLPPHETPVAGRPVVNVSLALTYLVSGLDVTGYHLGNIAIHLGCALLLYGIVRRTLQFLSDADPEGDRSQASGGVTPGTWAPWASWADVTALVTALVWAVHPLQSEVVDYVTQRTESTMALFFLLTVYAALRGQHDPARSLRWDATAVGACLLGMASKETMVTAPLVVALYDRTFAFPTFAEAWHARRRLYSGLGATWLALGLLMAQASRSTVGASATVGPWTYLLNQLDVVTAYLRLVVWPRALVLDYGLPRALGLHDVAAQAVFVGALLAATVFVWSRWPRAGFLAGAFFLTIAPSSSILPVLTEVGAERRMYVPSAALITLAVVVVSLAIRRLGARHPGRARAVALGGIALAACTVVGLAARTVVRNAEYRSPVALWRTVVARRPHGRAHYGLGTALVDAGQHDEALAELRAAVTDFPEARFALGTELFASRHFDEAAETLEAFIRSQPDRPDRIPARVVLGHTRIGQGKLDEAAREFQTLLAAMPSSVGARDGLRAVGLAQRDRAAALVRQQQAEAALAPAREAVRLLPADAETRNLLGAALASTGRFAEGIAQFQQALALDPGSQQARNNLAHAQALEASSRHR